MVILAVAARSKPRSVTRRLAILRMPRTHMTSSILLATASAKEPRGKLVKGGAGSGIHVTGDCRFPPDI
jgi:hypothetical protein